MSNLLFDKSEYEIQTLVQMADSGTLGLPDLQRGFVWKSSKVRDLLDSMIKGYPIGFIMLWKSQNTDTDNRTIGSDEKNVNYQDYVIIDGQQRITSLYAVIKGKSIMCQDEKTFIKIAFNPVTREFSVLNAAKEKNPEWINNISDIFANANRSRKFVNDYIENYRKYLEKKGKKLSEEGEQNIDNAIGDVLDIQKYPINALIIKDNVEEEDVAEVFTRVNSGGVELTENDFILTLMSVVSPDLRNKIEEFCKNSKIQTKGRSSYNPLIELEPQHIIRVAMAFTFNIARLKYAYKKLRGSDLRRGANNKIDKNLRMQSFQDLELGLEKVLNLDNWHEFIKSVTISGFINKRLISSANTLIYTYMMFLIGKYRFNIKYDKLKNIIARWFFMTSTTSHYTESFEAKVQEELNMISNLKTAEEFENFINNQIDIVFTNDYFKVTLPNSLITSSSTSAVWYTYLASLNVLNVKALFSDMYIRDLLSGIHDGNRKAVERHHIFPKKYLRKIGISNDRDINQIANYAYIEWEDNMEILDVSPKEYFVPIFERKIRDDEKKEIMKVHALPQDWYKMEYSLFLGERRKMMAKIIKDGFDKLKK